MEFWRLCLLALLILMLDMAGGLIAEGAVRLARKLLYGSRFGGAEIEKAKSARGAQR
jgi:hypothetical protein